MSVLPELLRYPDPFFSNGGFVPVQSGQTSWRWGLAEDIMDIKNTADSPEPRHQQPPSDAAVVIMVLLWGNAFVRAASMTATFPEGCRILQPRVEVGRVTRGQEGR